MNYLYLQLNLRNKGRPKGPSAWSLIGRKPLPVTPPGGSLAECGQWRLPNGNHLYVDGPPCSSYPYSYWFWHSDAWKSQSSPNVSLIHALHLSSYRTIICTRASGDFLNGIYIYKIFWLLENYSVFWENIDIKAGLRLVFLWQKLQ